MNEQTYMYRLPETIAVIVHTFKFLGCKTRGMLFDFCFAHLRIRKLFNDILVYGNKFAYHSQSKLHISSSNVQAKFAMRDDIRFALIRISRWPFARSESHASHNRNRSHQNVREISTTDISVSMCNASDN